MNVRSTAIYSLVFAGIISPYSTAGPVVAQQASTQVTRKACPTPDQQRQEGGKKNAAGNELPAAQPMEKSGILPAVGEDKSSAAPTVQQQVTTPNVGPDCDVAPAHPNALNQRDFEKRLPPSSK